LAFMLDNL